VHLSKKAPLVVGGCPVISVIYRTKKRNMFDPEARQAVVVLDLF
jgi:hypothetical protein